MKRVGVGSGGVFRANALHDSVELGVEGRGAGPLLAWQFATSPAQQRPSGFELPAVSTHCGAAKSTTTKLDKARTWARNLEAAAKSTTAELDNAKAELAKARTELEEVNPRASE